ncbi:hypothetical protein CWC29_003515 [Pseudoalteromonas sp. S4498]|uniref:hypothetical protein n=1 Tax=Pseudoalteromonas galatheae TaxID=579562 RepID=UPI001108E095|nr:hypothetical protein [Pseudoalteromonas galatheae]NKC17915.1 hypothetical protein [Pseudoalteromonas galatheae]
MFWIKQILRFTIVAVFLLLFVWVAVTFFVWVKSAEPSNTSTLFNIRSNVHWLKTDGILKFSFSPSRTMSVRVLSNGIFESQPLDDQPVNYAIEYQLLDTKGTVIYKGTYHHAAKAASNDFQQQVKQIIENREALAVASGQSFYLNREELQQATTITLKLIPENAQLKGVVVRVHAQTSNSITDPAKAWLKRPTEWRERMTNYHTIGENALTNEEKYNSVMLDWQKLAPQGVPNIDFRADLLYESLPYNVLNHDFSTQLDLDSLFISEQLSASFRVYEHTEYSLSHPENADLIFVWHDLRQLDAPKQLTPEMLSNTQSKLSNLPAGLVTISSNSPTSIRVFGNGVDPIVPLHSYYYMLNAQTPVYYQVSPESDIALEWRAPIGSTISVGLYSNNKLIKHYAFTATAEQALYDRLITETTERQTLPTAQKRYLAIPNSVNQIKIEAEDAMVKLQARSPTFNYLSHRCESICNPENPTYQGIDAWFSQKADNHYLFHTQKQIVSVRLFEAPPEVPEFLPQYRSKDLNQLLPVSDIALVPIEQVYFDNSVPKMEFEYRQIAKSELFKLGEATNYPSSVIVKQKRKPMLFEVPLNSLQVEALANTQALFINQGLPRTVRKIRLYKVAKATPITVAVSDNNLQPNALVVKVFSTDYQDKITVATTLDSTKVLTPSDEYTILAKHFVLHPNTAQMRMFFNPSHTELYEYPSITLPLFQDLTSPNTITLRFSHDVWISVLEEHEQPDATLNWWQNETP